MIFFVTKNLKLYIVQAVSMKENGNLKDAQPRFYQLMYNLLLSTVFQ